MMNLSLLEIAKACGGKLFLQDGETHVQNCDKSIQNDTYVTSMVLDSRKVEAGSVFVATIGERVDGHKFVQGVFEQGASLALVQKTPAQVETEHGIPVSAWGNYCVVEDTLQALKDIAEYYRKKLSVKVIGITGSVGKTSTKEFIAGVLAEKYKVLKTEGNFNNEIGVPLTLLRIRDEHEIAVVEMGISDFGEMSRLTKMARPNLCVITNIGQCHLENLGDRDGVLKAKTEMFEGMAEDGEVCLNGEDDKLLTIKEVKGRKPHFFGLGGNAAQEVWATEIVSKGLLGSDAVIHYEDIDLPVQVPQPGVHMVLNATAATCVARRFGMTGEEIATGISKIVPVSGRNNLIATDKYMIIDDCYNANPASMRAGLDLLTLADTKKVAILGDMFELGENASAMHAGVGAYAVEKGIDLLICIGDEAKHMYEAAVKTVADRNCLLPECRYFATKQAFLDAYAEAGEELIPNHSTVLVKASHGMAFPEIVETLKN